MTPTPNRRRWHGPPLAFQILGLLIGGLVVAQLVTLFLTMVLPPAPPAQYGLDDIAAVLRGETSGSGLQRVTQAGPPDLTGPGWLVSERSRRELVALLRADEGDVSLSFFTPLPFAGTATRRPMAAMADDGPVARLAAASATPDGPARFILAQAAPPPALPPGGGAGGLPRGDRPGGFGLPRSDAFPPGLMPGGRPFGTDREQAMPGGIERAPRGIERVPGEAMDRAPRGALPGGGLPGRGLYAIDPRPLPGNGIFIPGDGGAAVPPLLQAPVRPAGAQPMTGEPTVSPGSTPTAVRGQGLGLPPDQPGGAFGPGAAGSRGGLGARSLPLRDEAQRLMAPLMQATPPTPARSILAPAGPTPTMQRPAGPQTRAPILVTPAAPRDVPIAGPYPLPGVGPLARDAPVPAATVPAAPLAPAGPPIAVTPRSRALFGLVAAPFVEGDFVAAFRLPNGRWSVVQPAAEPFPNAWQRRLLLWFAVAFAIVAPFGWLFARRLVKPLAGFAVAAEKLGRDPAAAVLALEGPAEIGRAARAFNLMQSRLRSFVDDRTAMVGAISHDLRTPLTRLRFRIEDVPDDQREGMLEEVAEMEAMISSVLEFIRDASTPNLRERLDLRALVDDVVEDQLMIGSDVTVERGESATVEVDVLGMRRVLDNLLDNAVKYGARARVRLRKEPDSAIAEIFDDGPGLPEDELERVFEPFYRSEAARSSDAPGSGLGLAVCRSITRAHGGDVVLLRSNEGFVAQVRVPLAYGNERPLAA